MEWFLISWPTLLLLALGLRMALRLHYGARGPEETDPIYDMLNISSWVLFALGLIPAIFGGVFSILGFFIALFNVILAAVTLVEVLTQRRAAQRRSVCTLLALFVERRRQLETSVLLSAQTLRGGVGRAAKNLFDSLNLGVPLAQAVQENPRALPREAIAYIAAGETIKAESAALRELSQADRSELTVLWRSCVDRISYLSCVLVVMLSVLTFLMIKIVPAYVDIFQEFDLELPPMTELAVSMSNTFLNYLAAPTLLAVLLVGAAGFVIEVCYLCDLHVLRVFGDRVFRTRRLADVLRILAVATEQSRPIAQTLYRVAQVYPSPTIRRQLVPAAAAVVAGGAWQEALSKAGVVSPAEAALLLSAERTGSLPWALRQVAKRREKRAVFRLASAIQLLYPLVILFLGGVVGFYVVSLFIPIVRLIQGMTT